MNRLKSRELKQIARENLTGNYRNIMGAFLLVLLISIAIDLPFSKLLNTIYATTAQRIIYIVAEILISVVTCVLQIGLVHTHIMLAHKQPIRATDVLYCFRNHSNRYFGGAIIYFIFSAIAQAPMIIAMNVIGFSIEKIMTDIILLITSAILLFAVSIVLSLYFYVLVTDENSSCLQCLKKSLSLIKGNVLRLIYIMLSFIGMFILGILSLGIGFLWIAPYYQQTITCMYLNIIGELQSVN